MELSAFVEPLTIPLLPYLGDVKHFVVKKKPEAVESLCEILQNRVPSNLSRAVSQRKYEFLVARLMAQALLIENGVPIDKCWIGRHQRQPVWPNNMIGSISHSGELIAVAISKQGKKKGGIGIDIEQLTQEKVETPIYFNQREKNLLDGVENGFIIGFSAKEALYKCLHPICNIYFDFLDAEIIQIDQLNKSITLVLCCDLGENMSFGKAFRCDYRIFHNHVWSIVYTKEIANPCRTDY